MHFITMQIVRLRRGQGILVNKKEIAVVPVVVRYEKPPLRLPCSGFTALCCIPGDARGMSFFTSRPRCLE